MQKTCRSKLAISKTTRVIGSFYWQVIHLPSFVHNNSYGILAPWIVIYFIVQTNCDTCNLSQSKSQNYSLVVLYLPLKFFRNDKYKRKCKKVTMFYKTALLLQVF